MIDRGIFVAGMAMLAGAFAREMDPGLQKAYYGILSPEMTTDDFQDAVAATMREERFWPSPAVILQHAKASADVKMLALPMNCPDCDGRLDFAPGTGKRFLRHTPDCPQRMRIAK